MSLTQEQTRQVNTVLYEKLASGDPAMEKQALDSINDFTRTKMREEGFFRKIMPPLTLTKDDLDRQAGQSKPSKVIDKEPGSPAAISIPFANLPMNWYIRGDRYLVTLDRIVTPRFTADVDDLLTWMMDIRQVLSDNAIKDMLAEEDSKAMTAFNAAVVGAGITCPTSGTVQYEEISGGITRDSLWDAMKIMPSTPSRFSTHTMLINNITINEFNKFQRNEQGGDLAQDIMKDGWSLQEYMGKRLIITIKQDLVPTNSMFMWADPSCIGKHFQLEDVTLYVRREAYLLEFFAYETSGGAFGHTDGLARADFV